MWELLHQFFFIFLKWPKNSAILKDNSVIVSMRPESGSWKKYRVEDSFQVRVINGKERGI